MLRVLVILAALFIIAGCATKPIPIYDEVTFTVVLKDDIPKRQGDSIIHGLAFCTNTHPQFCTLEISKENYPDCLYHELRHAFEGNWHEGYESVWDCNK